MSKTLYIDVGTGEARTSLNGTTLQRLKLFLRDLTPLELGFFKNDENVTATLLEDGMAILKVGIRQQPGQGEILALATVYTIIGGVARITLSLNTEAMVNFFDALPASESEATLTLEVEVQSFDLTKLVTYYQAKCVVGREVNVSDDDPPVPAAEAAQYVKWSELPALSGLESLPDVQITNPKNDFDFLTWRAPASKWVNNRVADGGNF